MVPSPSSTSMPVPEIISSELNLSNQMSSLDFCQGFSPKGKKCRQPRHDLLLLMGLNSSDVHISPRSHCGYASLADNSSVTASLFLIHFCDFSFLLPCFADGIIKEAGIIKLFTLKSFSKHRKGMEMVMNELESLHFYNSK